MREAIPTTQGQKIAFFAAATERLVAGPAEFGLSPEQAARLAAMHETTRAARERVEELDKQRMAATVVLNAALTDEEQAHRAVYRRLRVNRAVPDQALAKLGMRRKARPSRVRPPSEAPTLALESVLPGPVEIAVRQPGDRLDKPEGVTLIELSVVAAGRPPTPDEAERGTRRLISRTQATVPNMIEAGRVRLYGRWLTRRAEASPWSLPVEFNPQIAG